MSLSDKRYGRWKTALSVEDVKEFIKKIKRIITSGCLGTSANCYKIKKKIDEEAGGKLA